MRPEVSVVDLRRGVPIMDELHKQGVTSPYSRSPSPASSLSNPNSLRALSDHKVAKSAFEITSVSDAPPDELEGIALSREAEELQQSFQMRDGKTAVPRVSNGEQEDEGLNPVTPVVSTSEGNSVATSTDASPRIPHFAHLTSAPTNGPSQSARSRFKRVTCYQRGRWSGKDTCEPEERPESELKMATLPSTSRQSDVPAPSSSPTPVRRAVIPITTVESVPMLSGRTRTEPSNLLHSHTNNEASSSADSRDAPLLDRITIAVEAIHSLSRTASTSSMAKLADEEEREREVDQESVISFAPSNQTPDLVGTEAQLTSVERPHQFCVCPECSRGYTIHACIYLSTGSFCLENGPHW